MSLANTLANETTSAKGAKAFKSTTDPIVDLVSLIGSWRKHPAFYGDEQIDDNELILRWNIAVQFDKRMAVKALAWSRDPRDGAGNRDAFRTILRHLAKHDLELAKLVINALGKIGRWDDAVKALEDVTPNDAFVYAAQVAWEAVCNGNGLAAKWMPRKGPLAAKIRRAINTSPKMYRKLLVKYTSVVETRMCENQWSEIKYETVPSVASARYRSAFMRHDGARYAAYIEAVKNGVAKINASAIYPHDVITQALLIDRMPATEKDAINEQWKAMPVHDMEINALPVVDVSGSMFCPDHAIRAAVSLGMLTSEHLKGDWKNIVAVFSSNAEFIKTRASNVFDRTREFMNEATKIWGMSTRLSAIFDRILKTAVKYNTPQEELPKAVIILSDMQFDSCITDGTNESVMEGIRRRYAEHGYTPPHVVFWNLASYDTVPALAGDALLISGFSVSVLNFVLETLERLSSGEVTDPAQVVIQPTYDMLNKHDKWDLLKGQLST